VFWPSSSFPFRLACSQVSLMVSRCSSTVLVHSSSQENNKSMSLPWNCSILRVGLSILILNVFLDNFCPKFTNPICDCFCSSLKDWLCFTCHGFCFRFCSLWFEVVISLVNHCGIWFIGWVSFVERWILLTMEVKSRPFTNFDFELFIFSCV